jgi:Tol biopolymer transport system component
MAVQRTGRRDDMLGYRGKVGAHRVLLVAVCALTLSLVVPPAGAAAPPAVAAGLIAFVREGLDSGVYTIDPSGSTLTRLTQGQDYRPRWSPDGTQIVFQRFGSTSIQTEIYVMRADGSNVRRLTQLGTAFQPAWSPDGSQVVFGSGLGRRSEIFVMNADGTDVVRLTRDRFADTVPAWSPDGTAIAFASRRHRNVDIYLMAPDGSDVRRLTHVRAKDMNPDWSPDGSRLVFQSHRHSNWDVYTILTDGSGLERLTEGATVEWAPAWSPDGTRIAFTIAQYSRGVQDIAVMTLGSPVLVRFVFPDSSEFEPDWQPA